MKLKYIFKINIALMFCSILMFNFIGCNKNEKNALEYLSNKYGEEFELKGPISTGPGGDEFHPSKVKITKAWPKDNPEKVFNIELYPEGIFYDDYQSITMKPYIDDYLTSMARQYWENANVQVEIINKMASKKYDKNHCEEYLADKYISIYYNIYLKYNNNFDIETESKKIYEICSKLREMKISNDILITYLSREVTKDDIEKDGFWRECDNQGDIIKVFDDSFIRSKPEKNKEITIENIKLQLEKIL